MINITGTLSFKFIWQWLFVSEYQAFAVKTLLGLDFVILKARRLSGILWSIHQPSLSILWHLYLTHDNRSKLNALLTQVNDRTIQYNFIKTSTNLIKVVHW